MHNVMDDVASNLMNVPHTLRRFSPRQWALLIEASATLALMRYRLHTRPLRSIVRDFDALPAGETAGLCVAQAGDLEKAREIGWIVTGVAPRLPFTTRCLAQGLAACQMLARRGLRGELHLGVALAAGPAEVDAHAWVTYGDVVITGQSGRDRVSEIAVLGRR